MPTVDRTASGEIVQGPLQQLAVEARSWLFEHLLPLWSINGRDPLGGFYDQLDDQAHPVALPKRCRVQTRQIYVFAEAGRMGWTGPWRECVEHGIHFLSVAFVRDDHFVRCKVSDSGEIVDDTVDNYDQAFALLAFAKAYAATGDLTRIVQARHLLAALRASRAHVLGGFHEAMPPQVPLRSNPHMHLLEAAVVWIEIGNLSECWQLAEEIVALCETRLLHPKHDALLESFELDWTPVSDPQGYVAEPGHQFEWAWLLMRWQRLGGCVKPYLSDRLYAFADRHGVDRKRNVAINEVYSDGRVRDATARLWPQTERLKAVLAMIELGKAPISQAEEAWRGLYAYALASNPGLFRDKLSGDGYFLCEKSFASSLYHITCAIAEIDRVANAAARG